MKKIIRGTFRVVTSGAWSMLLVFSFVVTGLLGFIAGMIVENSLVAIEPAPQPVIVTKQAPSSTDEQSPAYPTDNGLQAVVDDFVSQQTVPFGVKVKHLETGQAASYNDQTTFIAASLYKLVVGHELYAMHERGEISFNEPTGGGLSTSISECMNVMITISDNPCGIALRSRVGTSRPLPQLAEYGMTGTHLATEYPVTTASDMAQLLEGIYTHETLTKKSSESYLKLLKEQRRNSRLPQGLPSGTKIAHKTGTLNSFSHDVGIVYTKNGDYIISVLSGPWTSVAAGDQEFKEISKSVFDYFKQSSQKDAKTSEETGKDPTAPGFQLEVLSSS